ncbi:hypothetical protein HPB51_003656 [Rhipicephalus microplus]|uniref:Fucosyltransferase n=1 Tax=Rhipicephalus microplus TaxID=6941 RepID=A0A9J6DYN2_RHIMP|nr:hypothetical protein HPB51_003656 [Rhipicephalus microplus]
MNTPARQPPRPHNNEPYANRLERYRLLLHRFCKSPITMVFLACIGLFLTVSVVYTVIMSVYSAVMSGYPLELDSPPWTFWRGRTRDNGMPRILLWHGTVTQSAGARSSFSNVTYCKTFVGRSRLLRCEVTDDRSVLESSDAVVFQAERVSPEDMPSRRPAFQNWVLWTRQHVSPVGGPATSWRDPRLAFATCRRTHPQLQPVFDWSMSRREDSDIRTSYSSWRCGAVDDTPGSTKMADIARRNREVRHSLRFADRRDAAWITGKCDWHMCEMSDLLAEGLEAETRKAMGEDNKTPYELVYDAFEFDLVPVLLASPRTALRVPPFSVVDSAQFFDLGDLASHLRMLATNLKAYERYFTWKEHCLHVTENLEDDDVCPLCLVLNDELYNGEFHH